MCKVCRARTKPLYHLHEQIPTYYPKVFELVCGLRILCLDLINLDWLLCAVHHLDKLVDVPLFALAGDAYGPVLQILDFALEPTLLGCISYHISKTHTLDPTRDDYICAMNHTQIRGVLIIILRDLVFENNPVWVHHKF